MKSPASEQPEAMVKETVVKDDGRFLYLYTFQDPSGDAGDVEQPEETLEDPYV
jgi:hypothetical protein